DMSSSPVCALLHCLRTGLYGFDNVMISGAAADIALEPFADLLLAGVRLALGQIDRAHDHAGRAEAALQPVVLAERLLHGMQLAVAGQALNGRDFGAAGLHREQGAALDRDAVDVNDAGAALAGVAADMGAGQPEM